MDQLICTSLSHTHYWQLVLLHRSTLPCTLTTFPVLLLISSPGDVIAAFTSSFFHGAIILRPPSMTVSTLTSASNVFAFQSPVKRQDIALYVIGPLLLIPTLSSSHRTLKVPENDSLWQPPAAHLDESPRLQKSLTSSYLEGTAV